MRPAEQRAAEAHGRHAVIDDAIVEAAHADDPPSHGLAPQ